MNEATTARDMADGYVAAIGLAVRHSLVRTDNTIQTTTTYAILDSLGGPLSGEVVVYDFSAFTSCASGAQIGTVVPLSITQHQGLFTKLACDFTSTEVVAEFQSTGENFDLWSYDQCRIKKINGSPSSRFKKAPECRLFQDNTDSKSRFDKKVEKARKAAAENFGVKPFNYFGNEKSDLDLIQYRTTKDITADAFAFRGEVMTARLRADGRTDVTYAVLDDFGQFLPETLTLIEQTSYIGFGNREIIIASRDHPHTLVLGRHQDRSLSLAIADSILNDKDWPIDLDDDCYRDCAPGQFDRNAVRKRLMMTSRADVLEIAMRRLESMAE